MRAACFGSKPFSSGRFSEPRVVLRPEGPRPARMLLTKRKSAERRLLSTSKARRDLGSMASPASVALDHEKQLAVLDAVEWAVERWTSRELATPGSTDPHHAHAARLIAALIYLDSRFARLEPVFVTRVISRVVDFEAGPNAAPDAQSGPPLDAKAAAALLTVEVGAFRR